MPRPKTDFTGARFGRLTVIAELPPTNKAGKIYRRFRCQCSCGNMSDVYYSNIVNTKSCGCLAFENGKKIGFGSMGKRRKSLRSLRWADDYD